MSLEFRCYCDTCKTRLDTIAEEDKHQNWGHKLDHFKYHKHFLERGNK